MDSKDKRTNTGECKPDISLDGNNGKALAHHYQTFHVIWKKQLCLDWLVANGTRNMMVRQQLKDAAQDQKMDQHAV